VRVHRYKTIILTLPLYPSNCMLFMMCFVEPGLRVARRRDRGSFPPRVKRLIRPLGPSRLLNGWTYGGSFPGGKEAGPWSQIHLVLGLILLEVTLSIPIRLHDVEVN
jgi:hypothetical protein